MPTDPNNERYQHDFAEGEDGWGEGTAEKDGYQDIIDELEKDVPIVDAEAAIDDYRPLPGRRFVAEDTGREYIGDGSAWIQVASRGPNPTLQSATVEGATHTGELFVSDSQPVTAVAGTAGDYILRKTISLPISYSTTSTTYNTYFGNGYLVNEESLTTTNANDIYISTTAKIKNDTAGETTTFSIKSQGNTYGEISGTATSSNNTTLKFSGISDYTRAGVENAQLYPQIKVTGGSGDVQSASIGFWVKVGTQ